MAYAKQVWNDSETEGTPITAERLNHIEEGLEKATKSMFSKGKQVSVDEQSYTDVTFDVPYMGDTFVTVASFDTANAGYVAYGSLCANVLESDNESYVTVRVFNNGNRSLSPVVRIVCISNHLLTHIQ